MRNKTIVLNDDEIKLFSTKIIKLQNNITLDAIENKTINQDIFDVINKLPDCFVDLLFADPPYNLNKVFNKKTFKEMNDDEYEKWLNSWVEKIIRIMKPNASIYICGDWRSSGAIYNVMKKYFKIHNRITFEREKGRGAKSNWKNCSEDIWFGTMQNDYYFDVNAVKLKKKVIAPYKDINGAAKDWEDTKDGKYRLTNPSNIWTDITIPFWSMSENTEHPTQKPEKLMAKIILASSRPHDMIFDPFLGSGTTSVVAKKLGRRFVGIELDEKYAYLSEKRLLDAETNKGIQGYIDGVFWERNSIKK